MRKPPPDGRDPVSVLITTSFSLRYKIFSERTGLKVSEIALGYPHDLNSSSEQREVMTGGRFDQIDYPTHVVA